MREDDKFTYCDEIKYPSENDIVDVKVLNNDIRLLDEKKASKEDVDKVVGDISTSVGDKITGVAKERREYFIEDKVKELESSIKSLKEQQNIDWKQLKNLKYHGVIYKEKRLTYDATILNLYGSGYLIMALMSFYADNSTPEAPGMRVTVDGEIIYEVRGENEKYGYGEPYQLGIVNDTYTFTERHSRSCVGTSLTDGPVSVNVAKIICKNRREYDGSSYNIGEYYMIEPRNGWFIPLSSTPYQFRRGDGELRQHGMARIYNPCTAIVKNPIRYNTNVRVELFKNSYVVIGAVMYTQD